MGEQLWRVASGHAPDLAFQGLLCRYVALLEMGDPGAASALVEIEELARGTRQPVLGYLARSRRDGWDAMLGGPEVEEHIAATYELATSSRSRTDSASTSPSSSPSTSVPGRPDRPRQTPPGARWPVDASRLR